MLAMSRCRILQKQQLSEAHICLDNQCSASIHIQLVGYGTYHISRHRVDKPIPPFSYPTPHLRTSGNRIEKWLATAYSQSTGNAGNFKRETYPASEYQYCILRLATIRLRIKQSSVKT